MIPIFNTVTGIFGMRGSGKTAFLKGDDSLNIAGIIRSYPPKGMKVLIIDTIDHTSYRDIAIIAPEQLAKWQKGIYRIFMRPEEIQVFNKHINTLKNFYNTLLVYEDAYKHQAEKLDKPMKELIIDSKQKNIDIIFMYHAWAMAPLDLFRMIDYIEVFKTKDTPKAREGAMPGYYQEALTIHNEVMKNPSRFYHKTLNTGL
jgi:hypothetical protein